MKLEPVYVIAPAPAPKSMPTRRAFLLAASCGIGCACAGVAGGYALAGTGDASRPLHPDAVWAVDMLQTRTDGELLDSFAGLTGIIGEHPGVPELHRGLERLARVVIASPARPARKLELASLAGLMARPEFEDCASALADVRAALR